MHASLWYGMCLFQQFYTILQQALNPWTSSLPRVRLIFGGLCCKMAKDCVLNSLASNLGPLLSAGEVQGRRDCSEHDLQPISITACRIFNKTSSVS